MKIPEKLSKNTFRHLRGWINWNSEPLRLGDIVTVANGVMTRKGSIRDDFGVSFEVTPADPPIDLTVLAEQDTTVEFTVGGTVLPVGAVPVGVTGTLGVEVKFAREASFCFRSKAWAFEVIKNQIAVERAMQDLRKGGKWDRHYCVVTRALRTSSYLLAASTDASGSVKFEASGEIKPGDVIDIGDAKLGLVVGTKSSTVVAMVGDGGELKPTLLVGLTRLSFFGKPTVRTHGKGDGEAEGQPAEEYSPEEFTPESEAPAI